MPTRPMEASRRLSSSDLRGSRTFLANCTGLGQQIRDHVCFDALFFAAEGAEPHEREHQESIRVRFYTVCFSHECSELGDRITDCAACWFVCHTRTTNCFLSVLSCECHERKEFCHTSARPSFAQETPPLRRYYSPTGPHHPPADVCHSHVRLPLQ